VKTPREVSSGARWVRDLAAAAARIETRQAAYEEVVHRVLNILEVQNEKLDAILEAATREPGPSPVAEALAAILSSLREQESLLADLPGEITAAMRDVFRRDPDEDEDLEMEPAGPWTIADRTGERS
jgi:hypothetical protein